MNVRHLTRVALLVAALSVGTAVIGASAAAAATSHSCPPGQHWVQSDNACDDNPPRPAPLPSPDLSAANNLVFSTGTFQAWMDSTAALYKQTGYLSLSTHMWTDNWIGPYIAATGVVDVNVYDATGKLIYTTVTQQYEVTNPLFGGSDRTFTYVQELPGSIVQAAASLVVWQAGHCGC